MANKKKSGFAHTTDDPEDKPRSIDWDALNARHNATLDRWIEQGVDVPMTRRRKAELASQEAPKENKQTPEQMANLEKARDKWKTSKEDEDEIVRLYVSGEPVSRIFRFAGVSDSTVINILKRRNVYQPGRDMKGPKQP